MTDSAAPGKEELIELLGNLGQRGILTTAIAEGIITEIRCEMEECLCPRGDRYFERRPDPVSDWAPSVDHVTEKSAGGKLTLDNVRLAHVLCNRVGHATKHGHDAKKDRERAKRGQYATDHTALMKGFLAAFNNHDVDAIMSFFSDDCEFDTPRGSSPFGRQLRGRDEVREGISARFSGIPDVTYEDESHWACDDRGVSEWTLKGTTTDGIRIEIRGCDLFEFSGTKIRRKNSFWKIVD